MGHAARHDPAMRFAPSFVVFLVAGCPSSSPALDAAGTDTGPACAYVDTIARSCTTDADCVARVHQIDCCGTRAMIGIAASADSVYAASEPACVASYPGCGCPSGPTMTDSGETVSDPSSARAACVIRGPGMVCLTYVTMRPPDGR
jgi:hypothetical protein